MENQKQLVERLKQANNVLVTVSNDPSVDQLAACIGLSLVLNKLDKHAAAVYSGRTPSTIEFLQPGETLEKTTDSLRDFIISLDKSKADKLRYKVEDRVVRIFITPYRTSISGDDLEFSQGDFNVDVVVALGVHEQKDLDEAITAHGRILHDATVVTVNNQQAAELGSINWLDETASSLSEMVTKVAQGLSKESFDEQIATALLTGVVAETARFSNEKTSAETMKVSATLMAAGANQQLVATKLEAPSEPEQPDEPPAENDGGDDSSPDEPLPEAAVSDDGTLRIDHKADTEEPKQPAESPQPPAEQPEPKQEDTGTEGQQPQPEQPQQEQKPPEHDYPEISQVRAVGGAAEPGDPMAAQQPEQGEGQGPSLSSYGKPEEDESFVSPMSLPKPEPEIQRHDQPILSHGESPMRDEQSEDMQQQKPPEPQQPAPPPEPEPPKQAAAPPPPPEPPQAPAPQPPAPAPPAENQQQEDTQSLVEIERKVHSPHLNQGQAPAANSQEGQDELNLSDLQHPDGSGTPPVTSKEADENSEDAISAARDAVAKATAESGNNEATEPIQALNAQPLGEPLHQTAPPMPDQQSGGETGMSYEDLPSAPSQQPAPQTDPQQQQASPQTAEQSMSMPLPQPGQAPSGQEEGQNGQNGPGGEGNSDQQSPGQNPPNAPPAPSAPPPIMPFQ